LIHAIYIISNEGKPIFIREYSKSDLKIDELSNFVSAIADFSKLFSEESQDDGFSSFVLGQNGFIFHRNTESTIIAVIDAKLDSSDMSKIKKVYKKFQDKKDTITNGKKNKTELENFENEALKIVGENTGNISSQAIENLMWNKTNQPKKP
jgi:hypothetical protein